MLRHQPNDAAQQGRVGVGPHAAAHTRHRQRHAPRVHRRRQVRCGRGRLHAVVGAVPQVRQLQRRRLVKHGPAQGAARQRACRRGGGRPGRGAGRVVDTSPNKTKPRGRRDVQDARSGEGTWKVTGQGVCAPGESACRTDKQTLRRTRTVHPMSACRHPASPVRMASAARTADSAIRAAQPATKVGGSWQPTTTTSASTPAPAPAPAAPSPPPADPAAAAPVPPAATASGIGAGGALPAAAAWCAAAVSGLITCGRWGQVGGKLRACQGLGGAPEVWGCAAANVNQYVTPRQPPPTHPTWYLHPPLLRVVCSL